MADYGQTSMGDLRIKGSPGVKTDVAAAMPGIELWGHSIVLDREQGIKCEACDMEKEVPELLQMSSGFREVVYKMYILGKFRQETCSPSLEDIEDAMDDLDKNTDPITGKNHRVPPQRIHWVDTTTTSGRTSKDTFDMYIPQGQRMQIDGAVYTYHGGGTWVNESDGKAYETIDLFDRHGKAADSHFLSEVVQEKRHKLDNRKNLMKQDTLDTVGIGDLQDAGVNINDGSISQSQSVSIEEDVQRSAVEKMGKELSERKDHFLTR